REATWGGETRAAVLLVLDRKDRPQRPRFGQEWVVDVRGKVAVVAINDLPATWFWDWLRREVLKAVTASLLETPYPPGSADVLDPARPGRSPLCLSLDALADPPPTGRATPWRCCSTASRGRRRAAASMISSPGRRRASGNSSPSWGTGSGCPRRRGGSGWASRPHACSCTACAKR